MIGNDGMTCPNCSQPGRHYGGSWMGHIPEEKRSWVRAFLIGRGFNPCPVGERPEAAPATPAIFSDSTPLPNRSGNTEDAGL